MTASSETGSRSRFESFGRRVDAQVGNIGPRVEEEVRRVITYLNDEVVPQVRRNSSAALRAAAAQLSQLAEHLEESRRAQAATASQTPGPDAATTAAPGEKPGA